MSRINRGIRKVIKFIIYKLLFPGVYHLGAVRKIKNKKVVFVELQGNKISDNFWLLKEALEQRGGCILQERYLDYQKDSLAYYQRCVHLLWDISDAAYIFLNDSCNVLGAFSMRKESQMIQTWHACGAFKKWGFSVADQEYGESRRETVSSPQVCWAYQEAFQVSRAVIKPLGVSRTDFYFRDSLRRQAKEKYRRMVPWGNEKKCILYLPTFRGTRSQALSPDILDYAYLQEELGERYLIIEKRHPFVKEKLEVPERLREFVMGDCGLTVEELLCAADFCVTDYSSVVFEYAIMEKPILFLAYDLEQYFDNRGFYYEYQEFVPGPIVYNTKELLEAIKKVEEQPQEAQERVAAFRRKFMSACDGHATERILHEVLKNG